MTHTPVAEYKSAKLEKLLELYRKDKFKARVVYFSNTPDYVQRRLVLYEEGEDFAFVGYEKKFGISITGKMYTRETKTGTIGYKNGKFYVVLKKNFSQLTITGLTNFLANSYSYNNGANAYETISQYLFKRFSWLRFVWENQDIFKKKAFNTFVRNKLYSLNDALRYFYKVPLPVAKKLGELQSASKRNYLHKTWPEMLKVLTNLQNMNVDHMRDQNFLDLCQMSRTLGRTVNAAWSTKRVKLEHDTCAAEISVILLDCQELAILNIHPAFIRFAKMFKHKLLLTNKDLMFEGMRNKHCVGGYSYSVDSGGCAIFRVHDYTLEVRMEHTWSDQNYVVDSNGNRISSFRKLKLGQFKGYLNSEAPLDLQESIKAQLNQFNKVDDCDVHKADGEVWEHKFSTDVWATQMGDGMDNQAGVGDDMDVQAEDEVIAGGVCQLQVVPNNNEFDL